jgi:hypothetical protein
VIRSARWCRRALVAATLVVPTGCAKDLAFRRTSGFEITAPASRELVSEPLLVEWNADALGPAVKGFALFVDRAPQPPGKTIEHFALDKRSNIYLAAASPVEVPNFERRLGVAKGERDRHWVTVVALDAKGRRIGESYARVEFTVFEDQG